MIVFLLGLFIGCSILFFGIVIGFFFGASVGQDNKGMNKDGEPRVTNSLPKELLLVMDDYGELVDWVVESYENGSQSLTVQFPTNEGMMDVRFVGKERYLEQCLNIDNEG
jgi:hypothetical protein